MRKIIYTVLIMITILFAFSICAYADSNTPYSNGTAMYSNGVEEFYSNSNDEDKLYKLTLSDLTEEKVLDEHIISMVNKDKYLYLLVYTDGKSALLKFDSCSYAYSIEKEFDSLITNIAIRDDILYYVENRSIFAYNTETKETIAFIENEITYLLFFTNYNTLKYYTKIDETSEYAENSYSFAKDIFNETNVVENYGISLMSVSSYSPRLTAPSTSNPYYTTLNVFHTSGYGMVGNNGNCTCYAYGRSYENLGSKPNLSTGNAENWYNYNKNNGYYSYGKTPALGAVAVWGKGVIGNSSDGAGHVAVVEVIDGDTVTTSESGWNSFYFKTYTRSASHSNFSYSSSYSFQGFIYVCGENSGADPETPTYTEKPNKPRNIMSGKKVYKPGEEIIFSWDASENATDYKIQIWNGNMLLYSDSIGNVTSFTTPLADTGNCAICVSAGNPVGYSDYELYSFVVTSDIPNKPNAITANKLVCNTGEEVTFSWDAVNLATDYWVSIYNGDTKVYNSSVGNVTSFTSPFAYEGTYAFCVYSGNSNGYSQDTTYKFYVTNSVPQKPSFFSQKEIYKPNENIKFAWTKMDLATDYWVIIWKGDSQIESFSTNNTTEITRSFPDNGNYAILVCSMNLNGRSEYVMHQFSITEKSIISAEARVKNGGYIIDVQLYNITSGHIFVAGYNDNRLIDLKTPLFNKESVSTTLAGDIDEIKVMVWENLSNLKPLCDADIIPSSEFVIE